MAPLCTSVNATPLVIIASAMNKKGVSISFWANRIQSVIS